MDVIQRGNIYYADLSPTVGSEQGGLRPVVIIQNDVGNKYSPTVIVAAITSKIGKFRLPTHIYIPKNECGLPVDSMVLAEQVRTIDRKRLHKFVGTVGADKIQKINHALSISMCVQ